MNRGEDYETRVMGRYMNERKPRTRHLGPGKLYLNGEFLSDVKDMTLTVIDGPPKPFKVWRQFQDTALLVGEYDTLPRACLRACVQSCYSQDEVTVTCSRDSYKLAAKYVAGKRVDLQHQEL